MTLLFLTCTHMHWVAPASSNTKNDCESGGRVTDAPDVTYFPDMLGREPSTFTRSGAAVLPASENKTRE